jgi:hypothetical protein
MMERTVSTAGRLGDMSLFASQILPLLYGLCFVVLLVQAFRVMSQGFRAVSRSAEGSPASPSEGGDRTGMLTVHPELLDSDGQLTQEDLLTVRFGGDNEHPASAGDTA